MRNTTWNLAPPPGFQGLHPDKPVDMYHRHLPHWRQDGATYFVTFRLADSLPQSKLQELVLLKEEWASRNAPPHSHEQWQELSRMTMERVESWLDQGMGSCLLKQAPVAQRVVSALHFFDDDRYELGCYVVMPNHVHVVLRPLLPGKDALERILQSRKRQSSREINLLLERSGSLWQEESFDRIIRDEEHLYRCIQYVGSNPRRAGLAPEMCPRWVRPSWHKLGWGFVDENE
jgi:putative transposase